MRVYQESLEESRIWGKKRVVNGLMSDGAMGEWKLVIGNW
jgi:hypothetical protein